MSDTATTRETAYRGFISYSHRNEAIGRAIHRRLEGYRIPSKLVGSETARGAIPARLTPIFRDREELSAGESLSEQVQEALAASDCLIVLCSPDAKASKWVAKEIVLFRALHPDRPILSALILGEPDEAFPDALTVDGSEPIAADFRKGGDGTALATLKLVAGMTGVPLDALVQRDAQRQLRRVMAVTLGSLLALLAVLGLLVLALRAQREAERQRQEAEGLVEYMLTDLRDRLKAVGRLDVMTAVNERAMDYYAGQGALNDLPDESLTRRARVLHAMGEDDDKRGRIGPAAEKFETAYRATTIVLRNNPGAEAAIFAHAQSEYWMGYLEQKRGKSAQSLTHYTAYLALSGRFLGEKANTVRLRETAWAHNAIGIIFLKEKDSPAQARGHFERYASIFRSLSEAQPSDRVARYSYADALAWLADTDTAQQRYADAGRRRREQIGQLDRLLTDDPRNDVWRLAWISAHRGLFRACYRMKDQGCAGSAIGSASDWIAQSRYDAGNRDWVWQAAYVATDRGYFEAGRANRAAARTALGEARRFADQYGAIAGPSDAELSEINDTIRGLATKIDAQMGGNQ